MLRQSLLCTTLTFLLRASSSAAASIRQAVPARNPLAYAALAPLSSPSASPATPGAGASACSASVASGDLVYANAKIAHQTAGHIDCTSVVQMSGVPAGYRFSVTNVTVEGYASLEKGAYLEKIEVRLSYPTADGQGSSQTDVASVRNAYGKQPNDQGYEGYFSRSIPVSPGGSAWAVSPCSTKASMAVELFVSLAHEQVYPDDAVPHYGTVGGDTPDKQLKATFDAQWSRC